MKLGLTELQAKTYLTLIRFERAEIKKISEVSKIARQDLYRIIPVLEELGLVDKIVATPSIYKAIPLSEGSMSLFQKRSDEHARLKNSLELLIAQSAENCTSDYEEKDIQFVITSERKRWVAKFEKAYSESLHTDIMVPGDGLNNFVFNFYECLSIALSKGAQIRVIAQNAGIHPATAEKLEKLQANPHFRLKYTELTFDFGVATFYNREVNIALSNKEVPSLWTNNRQILKIAQMIFESEWKANNCPELTCKSEANALKIKQR
jgi:sugar-specific transcriptional regulator TrmB